MITIVKAYSIRSSSGSGLLIVGCGNNFAKLRNSGHQPHPEGSMTTSLGDGLGGTPDVACNFLDSASVERILKAKGSGLFSMVHFENLDAPVAADPKAILHAYKLLDEDGILLIECGGFGIESLKEQYKKVSIHNRPQITLNYLKNIVTTGGFHVHESNASICLVACKRAPERNEGFFNFDCYVTTATCLSVGLPDDCHQLQLLRQYRDENLSLTSEGRRIIDDYYEHAQEIVETIESLPRKAQAYREIYDSIVHPASMAIAKGDHPGAFRIVSSATRKAHEIIENLGPHKGEHSLD